MHFKIVYIVAKKGLAVKKYCIRIRTCLLNWIEKSAKLVLNNTWLNQTKINMDPERMIISAEASGFPELMREVLKNMDFEDLLKSRLISMTFYKFLIDENQRKLWIGAASKSEFMCPSTELTWVSTHPWLFLVLKLSILDRNREHYEYTAGPSQGLKIRGGLVVLWWA